MDRNQINTKIMLKKNRLSLNRLTIAACLILSFHTLLNAQSPPTHINAGVGGSTGEQVVINWTYMPPYTTYKIYRAQGLTGTWSLIGTKTGVTGPAFAEYTDTYQIQPQTEYCYKIKTCGTNCSDYSYVDCYTTTGLPPPATWSVSGYVTDNGYGIQDVSVSLDGYQTTTNSSGYYVFSNVINATTGYLTPFKTGYDFSPTNYYIYNLGQNLTNQNFTASTNFITAPTLYAAANDATSINLSWNSVSGANYYRVYYSNNVPLSGQYTQNTSEVAYGLNPNQEYCFYVIAYETNTGSGMVSAHSNTACATTQNNNTFTISGITRESGGTVIPYAQVSFTGLSSVTSGSAGAYSKTVQSSWSGTINASKSGYSFQPVTVNPVNQNLPNTDIIGTPLAQNAVINTSPSSLAFGDVTTGSTSVVMSFSISNTGSDPLTITGINSPYGFTTNGFTSGVINAGNSENVGVTFTPTTPTSYSGNITVNSNAANGNNTVAVSGTGVVGGNCTYVDVPSDHYAFDAVTYLCNQGLLDDDGYCEPEDPITRAALAKLAYLSIDLQQNAFADDFPSPFQDLQDQTTWYYSFAKNLSYLEYQDGIAPFDKTFFNFYASNNISRAHTLKVFIETWNIPVQTGTGLPFTDVPVNHDAYKYIYTAYQLGIIEDNPTHLFGPNVNVYRGEVFVMLYKIMDILGTSVPTPAEADFFTPGNYTPENFATFQALHSGNFNFYTKTSFAISSTGIPLSFEHTYNSYLTEMPDGLTPLKPLGKAWNHPYNSYVMEIPGDQTNPNDFRVVIALPNSGFHVYKLVNGSYVCETKGVYNLLQKPTSDKFTITTKNQIVYTYEKIAGSADDFPYVLKTVRDRNGNTLTVQYEVSSYKSGFYRIQRVTGTSGRNLNFSYHNATDLVSHITDPIGRMVYFNFDTYDVVHANPKLISFKDAKGQFSYYYYGSNEEEEFLLLSIQLPKGNVVTNTYEQKKLVSTQTNGNQPTTFNYQRNYGQSSEQNYIQAVKTDPFNKVTTIDYNKNGDAHHIQTEASIVDVNYNSTQTTKPDNMNVDGKTVSYTYDNMGNVLTMNLPMGVSHHFQYNALNDITQYTDPRGKTYSYAYDGNGNLNQTTTPRGTTTINNNSKGLVTSITNPVGITHNFSYDNYGNPIATSAPEGITTTSSYDLASRLISSTNPNGKTITYQYDANDNLLQETFNSLTTRYAYDQNDNLTTITNAKNGITSMSYDFQNDFLTSVSFGGNTDSYTYEDDGRLKTHTDPKNQLFTNFYDSQGRIQSINASGENVSYTYDDNNNINSVTNTNGSINFVYDDLNRVVSTTDFWGNQVFYGYDLASNITSIQYPGNKVVSYTYDDDNLLHSVTDWNNNTTIYTYRNDGLLQQTDYPNGTYCSYTYDNAGRMTGMNWEKSNATTINAYTFTLDPMGNHVAEQKTEPYTPAVGSAQTISYTYNNANRITQMGNTSFGFDSNGNTTNKGNRTYQYDKFDRLISVGGDMNAQYMYDGSGNRRGATRNGIVTRFVLDLMGMTNVLMETDASNNPQNYYVYGLGLISRIDDNNQTSYYHDDFRGSTIAMTDANANITHQYQYDDYGNILQIQEADSNPFRYVGKYGVMYEDETLDFMRARYYDPEIGRFISEDPIWSTNLYPYANNNPIMAADPGGRLSNPFEILPQLSEVFESDIPGIVKSTNFIDHGLVMARQAATQSQHLKDSGIADAIVDNFPEKVKEVFNPENAIAGGGATTTIRTVLTRYGVTGTTSSIAIGSAAIAAGVALIGYEGYQIISIMSEENVGVGTAIGKRVKNVGRFYDLNQYDWYNSMSDKTATYIFDKLH